MPGEPHHFLTRKRLWILPAALVGAGVVFYRFDPAYHSFFPPCFFHYLTGLDCPGCGSQRAVHALLHGNLWDAMDYNLLLVISLPVLGMHIGAIAFFRLSNTDDLRWRMPGYYPAIIYFFTILVFIFTVLRNIPIHPFDYLAA